MPFTVYSESSSSDAGTAEWHSKQNVEHTTENSTAFLSFNSNQVRPHEQHQFQSIIDELSLFENAQMMSEKLELKFKKMRLRDIWLLKRALAIIYPAYRESLKVDSQLPKENSHYCKYTDKLVKAFKVKNQTGEDGVVCQLTWS